MPAVAINARRAMPTNSRDLSLFDVEADRRSMLA